MASIEDSIYYRLGFTSGENVAKDCQREILKVYDKDELALLAGQKLDNIRAKSKTSLSNNTEWGVGFWSAFFEWSCNFVGL